MCGGSVGAAYVINARNTKRGNSSRCVGEWTGHAADLDAVAVPEIADTPHTFSVTFDP